MSYICSVSRCSLRSVLPQSARKFTGALNVLMTQSESILYYKALIRSYGVEGSTTVHSAVELKDKIIST